MYIILFGRDMVAYGCMYAVCLSIWVKQQNKTNITFKKWNLSFSSKCYAEKMIVRLTFIEDVLRLLTYCISARILLFISGTILSSRQFFWRREVSPLKANAMEKKMRMRLNLVKGCIVLHLSTHYNFLARMLLLIEGNIRQIAAYKQHVLSTVIFLVSGNAAMCIGHCTFWQQHWMSITHCML